MPIRKEKKIKVVPTTTGRMEGGDNYLFYSYDDSSARFVFEFKNPDGTALDLLNATPQALLILHEESGDKKVVTEDLGTISIIDGLVSFVIPDNVLGFRGKCDLYIALAFADGSSSDEVHVAFTIEESPFNKTYEEAADYYIKSFDVLLKEVELAKTNAINEINEQLPQVQSRLENVENGLRVAEGELEELLDGMNLQTMYSNSIDFGGYDYSGNPNLIANINADSFSQGTGALSVIDDGDEVVVTLDPNHKLDLYKVKSQPALVVGETYNMSVEIMLEDDFTGDPSKIALRYFKMPNWVPALTTPNTLTTAKGVWQKLTVTAKMTTAIDNAESWYITLYNQDANNSLSGRLRLRHAKLEAGSTATPYQPNLLVDPYWLGKTPLGENIADPTVGFPRNTSEYMVYSGRNTENYIAGQTYTLSMKATKLASQLFGVYIAGKVGDMKPTEGLTDTWELTFTVTKQHIDSGATNYLQIYQAPSATKGAVKIDWLKIEKSDTRTPNIEQYKYRGIGMRDSNNPKDYVWDLAPEYVEDNLATDVKISEITGKANNYTDNSIAAVNTNLVNTADDLARQINSNKTAAESYADTKKTEAVNESKKYTDEAITNITPNRTSLRIESGFSDGFTGWVTFERIGDIVIVSYALSPSTNTGTWKTPLPIASIPEEFRFSSNAYSTGSIATSNISNDICQVGMNAQGLQFASWNRTAGIAQFAGQLTGAVKSREK
ncbi:BppU family phage baseplate upper protein [Enterococcus faecium]|uniref:BppU family phage baseplate upper protein n=1 Tax=Enterococcus faecium TaxID=1352 RepID=UPI0029533081|nr:BppU family phage baseplate upper protein [Enterococcus faecium]MDV7746411.1 BppU family phage baseplate upper protein [Enterococcus faecium]